jgi:hypothetical protein
LRAGSFAAVAVALIAAVSFGSGVSAHRRDEYLQAARLAVEPGRVDLELDLTPGIGVSSATIADIDRDHDGRLSMEEKYAYGGRVFDAVVVALDGAPLHMTPVSSVFPDLDAFRHGEGTIHLRSTVALPPQAGGDHQLSFRNLDPRDGSVYLANALVPRSDRIVITAQRRDTTQRDLTIDYVLRPEPATVLSLWTMAVLTGLALLAGLLIRPSALGP